MTLSVSTYRALSKCTHGRITTPGGVALSRSTFGYINEAPEEAVVPDDDEEIGEGDVDPNGIPYFLSTEIKDMRFVEVHQHLFANPDKHYTGYAADGFYYENGLPKPYHVPFKATWASEGEGNPTVDRGPLDRFPDRLFVITTSQEVVLINADNLNVWVRFRLLDGGSTGTGTFLGDSGTVLYRADFANGFLLVATSDGLRIADFRNDLGYYFGEVDSSRSEYWQDTDGKGLIDRNDDGFLDYSAVSGRYVQNEDCRTVRIAYKSRVLAGVKESITVAAVGHPTGLTAVRLVYPGQSLPETVEHGFSISYSRLWSILDDLTPGTTSSRFIDGVGGWAGDGVCPGDILVTDLGTVHTITAVDIAELTIDPKLSESYSGSSYTITRRVDAVAVTGEAELFFANGTQAVTHVDSEGWFDGTSIDAFSSPFQTVALPNNTGLIHDIALNSNDRFFATDVGVYYASAANFEEEQIAEFRYSSAAYTGQEATYKIIEGDYIPCKAVALDPETGNLLVAATNGIASVVSEINLTIQQTFRFFEKDTEVASLMAFRNAHGPPDVESS